MGTFQGYLVKNNTNNTILDNSILAEEGYKSNPDQQTDEDSYTDGDGKLHRNILSHLRSKIWIKTLELSETNKTHIQTVFPSRTTVNITYWNDERNDYVSGDFYIPDIDWVIKNIKVGGTTSNPTYTRTYSAIDLTLIEY
ncbi:DUF6711 family protein [Anaerosporobacter faecicola]|uniref:DUF6711 family protein n=1 Tax=Anaerosporobacter faecicola TaxID=2718714 RepID=UPI00143A2C73|nr:DUF6711 family protein [Anaerosporobacter faecicola]